MFGQLESKLGDKIDHLITEAESRQVEEAVEIIEEESGATHADGSTDRNPGLNNTERARIDKAREDHLKDGGKIEDPSSEAAEIPEVDTESPSHMASILNNLS